MPRKNRNKKGGKAEKGDAEPEVKQDGPSLKEQADKAFQKQEFAEALRLYTEAIAADPTNHALFSNRSAAHAALKDFVAALGDAEKVLGLKPEWPKGYFRKGTAMENLLRYPEAYQAYEDGLKLDPKEPTLVKAAEDLKRLLQELKITEDEMKEVNPDSDKFTRMVRWLKDGGALFPKLYLQYYSEDYRGVHCLAKVPPDDPVLYVPFKYIMTSEVAKDSDIGKKIVESRVELRSKHSYLAAYLLQEKHSKNSFWEPYIRILPEFYANMPTFFDEPTLAFLKGSFTLAKIAERIDSLRKEYDDIKRAVPEFGRFTQDEFVWARLVVITRIFGLVIETNKTDGLVPYADMLNHKRPRETKWTFDDSRYGFVITSLQTIQRGEQVYDSYGRKCNSRFFVNYGFALDDNEDNEGLLRVELPRDDPHYAMKVRFLGREISARREYQVPGEYREKKCKELFAFMRFIYAQDSELLLLSSADGFKLDDIEPISIRNEIKALEDIRRACLVSLAAFPQTLDEDQKLLDSGTVPMYSNYRNCIIQRRGEKQVLQWFVDLADKCIPMLKMPWKELKRVAAKSYQGQKKPRNPGAEADDDKGDRNPTDAYITMVVVPLVKKVNS